MEFLYRDDQIIAVNKPAGLLTIPDGYIKDQPNLKNLLESHFQKVMTVHRLDKETSGVLLFALTAEAHRDLSIQFETRKVLKNYLALASGVLSDEPMEIDVPLRVNGDRKHRTIASTDMGKPAITKIEVLSQYEFYTLLRVVPKTGYIHQIRAHLSYIGHPIVNDRLYGRTKLPTTCPFQSDRLMLHAFNINFLHPTSHESMIIEAPTPCEFSRL